MQTDKKLDKYFYITGWIVIALITVLVMIVMINGIGILHKMPPCAFNKVTGLYCPGCGGTRATIALFRGQIIRSFRFHPFVLYGFVVGGWFMISQTIQRISKDRIKIGMHFRPVYLWIALAIVLINWLVKNAFILIGGIDLLD